MKVKIVILLLMLMKISLKPTFGAQIRKDSKGIFVFYPQEDDKYYFGLSTKVNWILAQQFCVYHNMSLVSIMDKSANLRLVKELEKRGLRDRFWTAGNDLGREGHYNWITNGYAFQYTDWEHAEPNNAVSEYGDEDCVDIYYSEYEGRYRWTDSHCFLDQFFICEKLDVLGNSCKCDSNENDIDERH